MKWHEDPIVIGVGVLIIGALVFLGYVAFFPGGLPK